MRPCRPRSAARRADARADRHPVGVARRGAAGGARGRRCSAPAASPVRDLGDTCVLAGPADAPLLLAGHLDTVPAQDNRPGRIAGGRVHGLGASDMKGALAVMIELALAGAPLRCLFFGREELPVQDSALTPLLAREPLDPELVVMMEPTACELHAGCLGNINATWTFHGRSGHSARPWTADNAIERAAAGVIALAAPAAGAARVRRARVRRGGERHADRRRDRRQRDPRPRRLPRQLPLRARAAAPPRPRRGSPCCAPGTASCGSTPTRRRGRSPPARASTRSSPPATSCARPSRPGRRWPSSGSPGLPAVNFGPGDPAQAHRRDESVEIAALARAYDGAGAVRGMKLSPVLTGLRTYPFVRLSEAKRRLEAEGVDLIDFGIGEPREETPAFIREALVGALEPLSTYPSSDGLPELRDGDRRLGRAALRRGARPRHAGAADAGLQGGDLPPRPGARRRPRRRPGARLPGLRARRACSPASELLELPLREDARLPARPRRRRRRRRGATSRSCGSTTRTTRPPRPRRSRCTSAPPSWRASTASSSPPTRRTPRSTSATRPRPRSSSPT